MFSGEATEGLSQLTVSGGGTTGTQDTDEDEDSDRDGDDEDDEDLDEEDGSQDIRTTSQSGGSLIGHSQSQV